jgi:hypothetical protein
MASPSERHISDAGRSGGDGVAGFGLAHREHRRTPEE